MRTEAIMQHAFIGDWAQQPHLSSEHRSSMHGLNRRFLDLAVEGVVAPALGAHVAPLSSAQRAAAADCPYALFDLRFQDDAHWRGRLQSTGACTIADAPNVDAGTVDFVRLALFHTWHLASSAGLAAHRQLAMHANTAGAFRRGPVDALPSRA